MPDLSALPVRPAGTRSRAGNAMARTRAAVMDGALRAVEKRGARAATMADIAALGGIAKATLYNHFRRKDDVWRALAEAETRRVGALTADLATSDLPAALAAAADAVAEHPALRRLAADEPLALAALLTAAEVPAWTVAREVARDVLAAAGREHAAPWPDVVVRWLVSYVSDPGNADARATAAAALAGVLPRAQSGRAPI